MKKEASSCGCFRLRYNLLSKHSVFCFVFGSMPHSIFLRLTVHQIRAASRVGTIFEELHHRLSSIFSAEFLYSCQFNQWFSWRLNFQEFFTIDVLKIFAFSTEFRIECAFGNFRHPFYGSSKKLKLEKFNFPFCSSHRSHDYMDTGIRFCWRFSLILRPSSFIWRISELA